MNCRKAKKMLSAYADNQLKDEQSVKAHIQECDSCRKELNFFYRQKEYLKKIETVDSSPYFRVKFWQKVRNAGDNTIKNRVAEKIWKWIPVPVFCSFVIILFLTFSFTAPLLYGQNVKTSEKIIQLAKKVCLPSHQQKIFSPLNFSDFCEEYCRILCNYCENKTGSNSGHSECGGCEK